MIADIFSDVRRFTNRELLVGLLELHADFSEENADRADEFVHELLRRIRLSEQWDSAVEGYSQ